MTVVVRRVFRRVVHVDVHTRNMKPIRGGQSILVVQQQSTEWISPIEVIYLQFREVHLSFCSFFNVAHIISGTGKASNFKFGRYIHRIHTNKSLSNVGENGAWAYLGTAEIFWVPPIISGTGKATNFKFCTDFTTIDCNKSLLTISGKVAVGVARDSRKFSGHLYIGRIARSSLR